MNICLAKHWYSFLVKEAVCGAGHYVYFVLKSIPALNRYSVAAVFFRKALHCHFQTGDILKRFIINLADHVFPAILYDFADL